MKTRIIPLKPTDLSFIEEVSNFLVNSFREFSPTWVPDIEAARKKIDESFLKGRVSRILVDEDGKVLGWVAAIKDPHVWEIHPIAVPIEQQRGGFGTLLIKEISNLAKCEGAAGIWAGTGDETGATSLSTTDIYSDPVKQSLNSQPCQIILQTFGLKAVLN